MQEGYVFDEAARAELARAYPQWPARFAHQLADHPLLRLAALNELAHRLPPHLHEYNSAVDLPFGISNADTPANGLTIHETIERLEDCGSWIILKNIENDPQYCRLMHEVLAEVAPIVAPATGEMLRLEGFMFLSSPQAIVPPHFDPDYNILCQVRGSKTLTLFPTADPDIVSQEFAEAYFAGATRNLPWRGEWDVRGKPISIGPGEAIYVPVLQPHWVQNHQEVSVSLSLTWRSEWSCHHADACRFNRRLRRLGFKPAPPRHYPAGNRAKSYGHRTLMRLGRGFGAA